MFATLRPRHPEEGIPVASFLVRSPSPSADSGKVTLEQLQSEERVSALLLFPLVAGLIGLFVGAADGLICRLPRRALLCGAVGLVVGLVGGFVCDIAAEIAYAPLDAIGYEAEQESCLWFEHAWFCRPGLRTHARVGHGGSGYGAWAGNRLRSKRLLIYGLLGGVIGGLLGGMLFDPIDQILLGPDKASAHWSRMVGPTGHWCHGRSYDRGSGTAGT